MFHHQPIDDSFPETEDDDFEWDFDPERVWKYLFVIERTKTKGKLRRGCRGKGGAFRSPCGQIIKFQ